MTIRTAHYAHDMSFGASITRTGTRFRLWAPECPEVSVHLYDDGRILRLHPKAYGWHELEVAGIGHGALYKFVLSDGTEVPDPASRYQPQDVHGPSQVIDPRHYEWQDLGWRGRAWEETVCYELHVGAFTEAGTFAAAREKLPHLAALGITAVELMPIGEFSGRWNWGYDGVKLFAPDHSYGTPDDLKGFIDTAHRLGLMVCLDVVYNHFGPDGNYMSTYAPLLTDKHETPWGAAVNYDDEGADIVRAMIVANIRFWLEEYRFDGLRFDAVHAIKDDGPRHLLIEIAEQARGYTDGRQVHLIVENSDNQAGWLRRDLRGRPWLFTAQWSDDIHHALHATLTGEHHWYYKDFANRLDLVGRSLAEGFAWQGEYMPSEHRHRGEPTGELPATAFMAFVQNHDHIGNRPHGDRLNGTLSQAAYRAFSTIVLLSPTIPLLFMGEEFGATTPFQFFSDVEGIADEIRKGREDELKKVPPALRKGDLPDPVSEAAFLDSKLDWSGVESSHTLLWYQKILSVRHQHLVPLLVQMPVASGRYHLIGKKALSVEWTLARDHRLIMMINLGESDIAVPGFTPSDTIWLEGKAETGTLGPMTVAVSLTAA